MTNYVFVHGAWHGGWCWRRVADPLRRDGHRVFTPSLTGLGDRAHLALPEIDLDRHIADIAALIESEELAEVVLIGHSYGGMVITGVADRLAGQIRELVYVDAFVPADGEAVMQLLGPSRRREFESLAPEIWLLPPISAEDFRVREAADRAWVDRRCVGMPRRCFTQPIRLAGAWQRVQHLTYVLAAEYLRSPFHRYAEALRADPRWRVTEIACGHEVMIDAPDALRLLLLESVASGERAAQ